MNRHIICAIGFAVGSACAIPALPHDLTLQECNEGGEFIRNAALARDNGMTRAFFLGKLEEDLMLIRAFPPQLRWFAQDADDERLLTEAVLQVFDEPLKPEQHEAVFIMNCTEAAASIEEEKSRDSM
ncbi:MAG: hypothetical protein ACJ8G2_12585 [Burkholderiales bacterium]